MKKLLALALALMLVMALAACGGGAAETTEPAAAPTEAPIVEPTEVAEAPAAPAAPAEPAEGEASGEPTGEPTGEASGEPSGEKLDTEMDFDITVNGASGTAHYADTDNGDQATKTFEITFEGRTISGSIDKGVWTADSGDAADQAVIDAVQAAFEGANAVGPAS